MQKRQERQMIALVSLSHSLSLTRSLARSIDRSHSSLSLARACSLSRALSLALSPARSRFLSRSCSRSLARSLSLPPSFAPPLRCLSISRAPFLSLIPLEQHMGTEPTDARSQQTVCNRISDSLRLQRLKRELSRASRYLKAETGFFDLKETNWKPFF